MSKTLGETTSTSYSITAETLELKGQADKFEMTKFQHGIMAGDLDSLLEMFEEAETALSSSVGCISLSHDGTLSQSGSSQTDLEKNADHLKQKSISYDEDLFLNEETDLAVQSIICFDSCDCRLTDGVQKSTPTSINYSNRSYHSENITIQNSGRTFTDNTNKENFLNSRSFEKWETSSKDTTSEIAMELNHSEVGNVEKKVVKAVVTENSASINIPSSLQKDDLETSIEWDNDFPSDGKWSDSSSSSSPDHIFHGRSGGSTVRKEGPRRQQGRGQVKPMEEEKLYDRLPSYYTVFSRPNRTATGIVRSSRSCLKLVLNSELRSPRRDPSPVDKSNIFDKVPAYQSCFTNSTRYDDNETDFHTRMNQERGFDLEKSPSYSRGHGSGSTYTPSRFRSRSRLRAEAGPRIRRSGRASAVASDFRTSVANSMRPGIISVHVQNSMQEFNQNRVKGQQRRILYIGCIPGNFTAEHLKAMFEIFGQIETCTVHFRECGNRDNYGFVTYKNASDAYKAVEGGNRLPGCANFDICFGGRRNFCRADYSDLDGNVEMEEDLAPVISKLKPKEDFDDLLMDELLKRKLH